MKCSLCDNPAILSQRYSGRHLCTEHFTAEFEQRVEETLRKSQMIEDCGRIAVAVSGGKDSTVTLYVLEKMLRNLDIEIFAITVDEGIKGYRDDTMRSASRAVKELGLQHEIVSFRDEFGIDLDYAVRNSSMPCSICGVLRKNAINRAAKRFRATIVATGHNLDDEVQSIMMNYLKGDIERLARLRPKRNHRGLVPRIKPLREIPEREVALYGMVKGFYEEARECPYASLSMRSEVRAMMNRLEDLIPGSKLSTLRGYERIHEVIGDKLSHMILSVCRNCGEPSVKELCKACQMVSDLKGSKEAN